MARISFDQLGFWIRSLCHYGVLQTSPFICEVLIAELLGMLVHCWILIRKRARPRLLFDPVNVHKVTG